jgi:hypothetical protein
MTTIQEKKLNVFMWIVGTVITIFVGGILALGISYGSTNEKVNEHELEISDLKKTSVNYVYVEYLVKSNQKIVKVLNTIPGTPEYSQALQEWEEFQSEVLNRGNPTRGTIKGTIK